MLYNKKPLVQSAVEPPNTNVYWVHVLPNSTDVPIIKTFHNGAWTPITGTPQSSSDLNGTNYLMVYGTGTPEENAAELQAAYDEAKKMPRYLGVFHSSSSIVAYKGQTCKTTSLDEYFRFTEDYSGIGEDVDMSAVLITESEAKSTRTTVVVAPGQYKFGTYGFTIDTSYISIVSLTGDADVFIDSSNETDVLFLESAPNGLYSVYLKGLNCKNKTISFPYGVYESTFENCVGGQSSFGGSITVADSNTFINCLGGDGSFCGEFDGRANAKYINCTGGNHSFGGADGDALGTFSNCIGGDNSFGADGTASGIFTDCTGGGGSFGGMGTASGTFTNCTGGGGSFGGDIGTASGIFTNCTGGDNSFGGVSSTASGTFNDCTGGYSSFGGYNGTFSGTANNCKGGGNSFGGEEGIFLDTGMATNCTGGGNSFGGSGGTFEGTANNCTGGDNSFGGDLGTASGTFTNCTGGGHSFGGVSSTASGTFTNCTGGGHSFGGEGGVASGTFSYCTGGDYSFGGGGISGGLFSYCKGGVGSFGGDIVITGGARLYFCRLAEGVFISPVSDSKLVLCVDGGNDIITI